MNGLQIESKVQLTRILVVDDDAPTLRLIQFLLNGEGFDVLGATDSETALGTYLREPPDLMLLNVVMPCADGFELYERFRDLGYAGPVVFVTGRPDVLDILRARQMEVAGCLMKPLHPDDVVLLVRKVLDTARGELAGALLGA